MKCQEKNQMLLASEFNSGDIMGVIYDFQNKGDILPKHAHTKENIHITIVARGRLKAYSHDWEQEAIAGQIIDFRADEPHELMALEDNTRIVNILKTYRGKLNEYITPVKNDE